MREIYIADLDAYCSGELKGEWITLPTTEEEIQEVIMKHSNEGLTDFAIHDWSNIPFSIGEYTDPFKINRALEFIEENKVNEMVIEHLETFHSVDFLNDDLYEVKEKLENVHSINAINDEDFAQEYYIEVYGFNEDTDIPYGLYVDWSRVYRELEIGLNITTDYNNDVYYYSFI